MEKECDFMVRKNHNFEVPEHPVIRAMERYGQYPAPDKNPWEAHGRWSGAVPDRVTLPQRAGREEAYGQKAVYVLSVDL